MRSTVAIAWVVSVGCSPALKRLECPTTPATRSELTHTVDTQYFEVDGRTPRQILAYEIAHAPFKDDLKHAVAMTRTQFCPSSFYEKSAEGTCRLLTFRLVLRLLFVMPAWKPSGNVAPSTREWWIKHAELGSKHEQGHAAIALQTADEIYREVLAVPEMASCAALDKQIQAIFDLGMQRLAERQRAYDDANVKATEDMPTSL
jgi:predicted secreted Zn-dependent protease